MVNHHFQRRNVAGKKSWMILIWDHLKVWWNHIVKKSTVELTAMLNSECTSISTCTMWRELKGLNSCVALKKHLSERLIRKKGFNLLGSIKIELGQWRKVMWSDVSRFTLFQSIRVKREADEVTQLLHPVPTIQACRGSVMIWVCNVPKILGQLTTWIYWMTRFLHEWNFPFLMARAYSKMTMPGFTGLKLWKSGSGSMRYLRHYHTWINPIDNLWDALEKMLRGGLTLQSSIENLGKYHISSLVPS